MKCLDEGIDVKRTEYAILIASSTNPRQYIQRRGRILRPHPDKMIAHIHDLFVLPPLNYNSYDDEKEDNTSMERIRLVNKALIRQELKRLNEFAISSLNYLENINIIRGYCARYGIEEL